MDWLRKTSSLWSRCSTGICRNIFKTLVDGLTLILLCILKTIQIFCINISVIAWKIGSLLMKLQFSAVKTLNSLKIFSFFTLFLLGGGYGDGYHAPGLHSPGVGDYLCAHHVLLSHAAAYHLYKDTYFTEQQGKIGIVVNTGYNYRGDDTVAPEVAERAQEFESGRFANPIFSKEGGYPQVVIDQVNMKSEREGRPWSRLPSMTPAEQAWIQGTADFMALNYYTSSKVWPRPDDPNDSPSIWSDTNVWGFKDDSWKKSASDWLVNCPQGLQDILVYIKNKYDNPFIMITENGWSDLPGVIQDDERVQYVKAHLAAISRAIKESECKVVAYTVWSLTDNFEWARGYTERFGIHYIDFDSAEKTRVPKASAIWFKEFMKTRKFEYEVEGVWGWMNNSVGLSVRENFKVP